MSRVEPERNRYVGHRYVPKIFGEWDKQNEYEGLSIVTHQGTSYTSKKRVPVGIDILNEEFWVVTGNYDAQVEYYRQDVRNLDKKLTGEMTDLKENTDEELMNLNSKFESEFMKVKYFEGSNDDEIIKKALEYAISNNEKIIIEGNYNITENIDDFMGTGRKIKNLFKGNGSITRGNDTFYFQPTTGDINTLYVGEGNSWNNDGLTRDKPIAFHTAISFLSQLGELALDGQWKIKFIGHYNGRTYRNEFLPWFKNPLIFEGERDNENKITSILDGAGLSDNYFFRADNRGTGQKRFIFRDLHFKNWNNAGGNSGGIVLWDDVSVIIHYCESTDCGTLAWVTGGIFLAENNIIRNAHTGMSGQYHTKMNIHNNKFYNCTHAGVHFGRNTAGHTRGNEFTGCNINIEATQSSRLRTVGNIHNDWGFAGINLYLNATWEGNTEEIINYTDYPVTTPFHNVFYGSTIPQNGSPLTQHQKYFPFQSFNLNTPGENYLNETFSTPIRLPDYVLKNSTTHIKLTIVYSTLGAGFRGNIALSKGTYNNSYINVPMEITGLTRGELIIDIYTRNDRGDAIFMSKYLNGDKTVTDYQVKPFASLFTSGTTTIPHRFYGNLTTGALTILGFTTYISQ